VRADLGLEIGTDIDAAGTDNSTNVSLAGTPDYITLAGQVLTRNQIDLTADVTGVLPVANFATGTPDGSKFVRDDGTLQSIPGGGDALVANPLSQFAATTSAQLAGVLSDETGSGAAVFATSPTLVTPTLGVATATSVNGLDLTENSDGFEIAGGSSNERTLTVTGGDITLSGGATTKGDILASDGSEFDNVAVGANGTKLVADSAETNGVKWTEDVEIKGITIPDPTSSEDIGLFFTDVSITVTQMNAVLRGSSTPSVTCTVRHNSARSATGAEVVTSGTTTTSTTTGSEVTSFNDATIPAGSWVWLETTAQSGTVDELTLSIEFSRD